MADDPKEPTPGDLLKNSSLYREFQAEREEILKHKWIESEKAGHDIGFERDQRNNGITHKIDPEIDGEREYIAQSLNETGLVAKVDYMTVTDPIKEAKTATGGSFR